MKKIAVKITLIVSLIFMSIGNPYVYATELEEDNLNLINLESVEGQELFEGEEVTPENQEVESSVEIEKKKKVDGGTSPYSENNAQLIKSPFAIEQLNQKEEIELTVNSKSISTQGVRTSKLGKFKSSSARIYDDPTKLNNYTEAGSQYLDQVFYIKLETTVNKVKYFLVSTKPSSQDGLIGWVKSSDLTTYDHKHIDTKKKTIYFKGTGVAYNRAWGGPKNLMLNSNDMKLLKYKEFTVNMTEKVGNNVWYRGTYSGSPGNVWIHSSHLLNLNINDTSKLGQIKNANVYIYKEIDVPSSKFIAGESHLGTSYFIKKQVKIDGKTYYLLSTDPSSIEGMIGWVQSTDVVSYDHRFIDNNEKTFYFKGSGVAYNRAWGGTKNLVLNASDLKLLQYKEFKVNLTEAVGNNLWFRGTYEGSNRNIWIHSNHLTTRVESNISRVGQLQKTGIEIYRKLDDINSKFETDSSHLNRVFYIKKQVKFDKTTFYLISLKPSATEGVIGWVNSKDILSYTHEEVDSNEKILYLKGTGVAYSEIWGGSQNLVFNSNDLSKRKGYGFRINLTQKVGNNVWYRGTLDGQQIWIHANHLNTVTGTATSKLGKLKNPQVSIVRILGDPNSTILAGETFTDSVYYIKRETTFNGKKYYLISNQPSSTAGTIGWVEESDVTTHDHVGVDAKEKIFYLKGTGVAYNRPWGGPKNVVFNATQMQNLKGKVFYVHLTQKVGNNLWYRGTLEGQTVWIHYSHLNVHNYSTYNMTFNSALNMQMKANPQTDTRYAWVSKEYIKDNKVTADVLNVRLGPGTNYKKVGELQKDTPVKILDEYNGWYVIDYNPKDWVHAGPKDVRYYLNPNNFINDDKLKFQFLDLSIFINAPVKTLNNILKDRGILHNKGAAFSEGAKKYSINEIYLIAHAILETGHGTSDLSNGSIKVGKISDNKWVSFLPEKPKQPRKTYIAERYYDSSSKTWKWKVEENNDFKESQAKDVKRIYNMFGIGAYDSHPLTLGSVYAYREGWFTPEAAIIGGAKFVGEQYINHPDKQNTLYKMRWNPNGMVKYGYATHQYATDIGWAAKQAQLMYSYYQYLNSYTLHLDIPVYK